MEERFLTIRNHHPTSHITAQKKTFGSKTFRILSPVINRYLRNWDQKLIPFQGDDIHWEVSKGNLEDVTALLDARADIDTPMKTKSFYSKGSTLLHIATYNGHINLIKVLISRGANFLAKDINSQNTLNIALGQGHSDVFEILKTEAIEKVQSMNTPKR